MNIRPATTHDIPLLGKLMCETMQRWGDVAYGLDNRQRAEQAIADLAGYEDNRFSHKLAHIVDVDGIPAGMLLSFPGERLQSLKNPLIWQLFKIHRFWDALRCLRWIMTEFFYADALPDEYHIAHLAVMDTFRRQGIAKHLLNYAEQIARQQGLKKCSLEVGLDNQGARDLYDSYGYEVVDSVSIKRMKEKFDMAGFERRVKTLET